MPYSLGKHGFLMIQIKRLLPNELPASERREEKQKKETLRQARGEGKIEFGSERKKGAVGKEGGRKR